MRVLVQRVIRASVHIEEKIHVRIGRGIVVFAGFELEDGEEDLDWVCQKLCQLRIFDDDKGLMNLSLEDVKGEILIVSQFTLHASVKKGNRPSYIKAAKAETAIPLYQKFTKKCAARVPVKTGSFGADMQVELINDGPVTLWVDSKNRE